MVLQSLFARFKTGLQIATASFGVLRREQWLLLFPLLYGLAWVVGIVGLLVGVVLALFAGVYGLAALEQVVSIPEEAGETAVIVIGAVVSFVSLFVATSVATFFSAALVHSVGQLFEDEPTSLRDGFAGAWQSKRTILAWGVVGAVVGSVFRILESQDGAPARIVRSLAGFAWFAMTFFIVPVIVFREGDLRESVGESIALFRDTWGEVGGISLGIGFVVMAAALPVLTLGVGAPVVLLGDPWTVLPYTLVPTIALLGALAIVHNAATAIAKTALYQYAADGTLPEEFDGIDPDDLARGKRKRHTSMGGQSGQQPGQI